jgi:hypothetical protein
MGTRSIQRLTASKCYNINSYLGYKVRKTAQTSSENRFQLLSRQLRSDSLRV